MASSESEAGSHVSSSSALPSAAAVAPCIDTSASRSATMWANLQDRARRAAGQGREGGQHGCYHASGLLPCYFLDL